MAFDSVVLGAETVHMNELLSPLVSYLLDFGGLNRIFGHDSFHGILIVTVCQLNKVTDVQP